MFILFVDPGWYERYWYSDTPRPVPRIPGGRGFVRAARVLLHMLRRSDGSSLLPAQPAEARR